MSHEPDDLLRACPRAGAARGSLERLAREVQRTRVLAVDLDDADLMLALHLALRALRLTQSLSPDERL